MTGRELGPQDVGKIVECPKCHERGRVAIVTAKVGGRVYRYLAVRHPRGAGKSKRCIIRRLDVAKVTKEEKVTKEKLAEGPIDVAMLKARVEQLEREKEQLERENAQLRAQLEQLKPVQEWLMYARQNSIVVGEGEADAIFKFYQDRKGYTAEERDIAQSIVQPLFIRGLSGEVTTIVYGSLPAF